MKKKTKRKIKRGASSGVNYWAEQLTGTLKWLSRYKWALSGFLFVLSIIYLNDFIGTEEVPLSITSASVVAAIPAVFAHMLVIVVILTVYICMPIAIFFIPRGRGDAEQSFAPKTDAEFNAISKHLMKCWLSTCAFIFMALFAISDAASYVVLANHAGLAVFLSIVIISGMLAFLLTLESSSNIAKENESLRVHSQPLAAVSGTIQKEPLERFWLRRRKISGAISAFVRQSCKYLDSIHFESILLGLRFSAAVFVAVFIQTLTVILVADSVFVNMGYSGDFFAYSMTFLCCVLLAMFQLGVVKFLTLSRYRNELLKNLVGVILFFMFVFGMFPPLGSFLFGGVLRHTSSGARSCAVISWAHAGAPAAVKEVNLENTPGHSLPLRIFTEVDGYYIVRILNQENGRYIERKDESGRKDKSVYFIPRTLVAGMAECSSPRRR